MELQPVSVTLMALASLLAGFVDAVAGGGGLLQIPALMVLFPGLPPATLLGTNKLVSICGTAVAAWRYTRSHLLPWRTLRLPLVLAFAGSALGAYVATQIAPGYIRLVVLAAVAAVALVTLRYPQIGLAERSVTRHAGGLLLCVLLIGLYDGFVGPGTGTFLIFALTALWGRSFLQASAASKAINLATNLSALLVFAWHGHIHVQLAAPLLIANMLGGWLGARVAIRRGAPFVRAIFLCVVFLVMARLAVDIWR